MAVEFGGRARVGPVRVGWAAPRNIEPGAWLGPADARRAAGFAAGRRREFLTGRALVGQLLAAGFGEAGRPDTAPCPRCGGDHGPVLVRGVPAIASVAYTDGFVVAAVAADAHALRLGVDAEAASVDPVRDADLGRLLGVGPDQALRRWTRVEAVLKASGGGLRTDPGLVRVAAGTARVGSAPEAYRLEPVAGPPGLEISVAWLPPAG